MQFFIIAALAALATSSLAQDDKDIGCFVPGECVFSPMISITSFVESAEDCLENCVVSDRFVPIGRESNYLPTHCLWPYSSPLNATNSHTTTNWMNATRSWLAPRSALRAALIVSQVCAVQKELFVCSSSSKVRANNTKRSRNHQPASQIFRWKILLPIHLLWGRRLRRWPPSGSLLHGQRPLVPPGMQG